jgi:2-dehydro-3-deoxyphosphooctonate aldolase (KDO 8-P synthase)
VSIAPVAIGPLTLGAPAPLLFIGGPCVIESPSHALDLGRAIQAIAREVGVPYVFKASFDKANRTWSRQRRRARSST